MTVAEEKELIQRIMEGEKDLFRTLVDAHGDMVFAMLYRMTGNRQDAEDLAQEVFVKAYFALKKYRSESTFSTWLYRIAYNMAVSSLRKSSLLPTKERLSDREMALCCGMDDSGEVAEFKLLREKQYAALERAIMELLPQERFLVTLFYEEGHSINEIAGITGMSPGNVKVRLFRCRNRLAQMMGEKENKLQKHADR